MKLEKPEMEVLKTEGRQEAMGPEDCSVVWHGCCYKE